MSHTFSTIAMDCPWPERGGTALSAAFGPGKRGADNHYPTLTIKQIPSVILGCELYRPADSAHLYMWATSNYLMGAGWVMGEIGFRYVACVPWVKTGKRAGLGQYFRGKAEYLLFGVRGRGFDVRTDDRYVVGLIEAPVQGHSVKPQEAYDLIERRSHGPYLEMFARTPRPGWTVWGNEVTPELQTA